ncbi:MAG TPA: efflux RND transporter periplasmic adaptor subunit [Polyangia bacterium]|jgi:HlyD family secretion protein
MRRLKRGITLGILALVIAGSAVGWSAYSRRAEARQPQFQTATVERGRVTAKVTATGTLSATVTVQVGSQVSGRIQQLFADFNSAVTKGQVIAKIDPELFQATVAQARANVVAAEGNLAKARAQAADAKRQLTRQDELAARKLVAPADRDTAQANAEGADAGVAAARGALEQARANLKQARINLDYTTIVSPTDGVVISRNVDVGQTVAAALQAPTLFTIARDLTKMQVDTSVAEADVGRLRPGMAATFTVDAYPGERFQGVVRQIRNAPQTVQNVVTYDAVIDVANGELKLKPGMTANASFVYADREDVLRVPNAALRFRPAGRGAPPAAAPAKRAPERPDQRTAWVLQGGQPQPVRLTAGATDGTMTEVAGGGLQAGDLVIIEALGAGGHGAPAGGGRPGGGGAGMGGPRGPRIL